MIDEKPFVCIGTLATSHGTKGAFKVNDFGNSWEYLKPPFPILLIKNTIIREFIVKEFSIHPNYLLVSVENIGSPEEWKDWRGAKIYLTESIIRNLETKLEDNTYFYYQLIGLEVRNDKKEKTGYKVVSIQENPAHPILEIEGNGKKILIPFVNRWVEDICLSHHYLIISNWEDWLEV